MLASRAAALGLSAATVVLTTRILGPVGYGTFAYVTVIAMLIFTVGSAWTSPAVTRFGREMLESHGDMRAVSWERFVITAPAVGLVAAGVVALGVAGTLPRRLDWALVSVAIVYGVLLVASDHLVYVLQALGRFRVSSLGVVLRQLAVVAVLPLLFVFHTSRPVLAVMVLTLIAWLALTIAFTPFAWSRGLWPRVLSSRLRRRMLLFSFPLLGFTLSQYVIQTVDLPIIGTFRSTHDVGLYAVSYQVYTALQGLAGAVVPVLTPLFVSLRAAGKEHVIQRFCERTVSQMTLLVATGASVLVPLVPLLVPHVFGSSFAGATRPLVILLGASVLLAVASFVAPVLVLHEATRAVGVANLAAAALNVLADLLLLGPFRFGIWAPAAATAAALALITWSYAITARRLVGARRIVRPLALAPLTAGLAIPLALGPVASAIIGPPAALALGLAVLMRGGLVDASDAELLQLLEMPSRLKRIALAGMRLGTRFGHQVETAASKLDGQ